MILCPSILQHQKLHGKYYWWNCVLIHAEKVSRPFSPRSACLEPFGGPDAKLKLDPVGLSLMRTGQQQESTGWEYSQFSSTKNQNKIEHLPPALSFPFCNTPWPPRYQAKLPPPFWIQAWSFSDKHSSKGSSVLVDSPLSTHFRRDAGRVAEKRWVF